MLRLHPRQRLVQLEQQLQLRGVDPQIFLDLPRGMPATPALLRLTPVRVVDQHPAHHPRCHRQEVGEVLLFSGRYDEALVATPPELALRSAEPAPSRPTRPPPVGLQEPTHYRLAPGHPSPQLPTPLRQH
jgi:hypothetical protein